MQVDDSWEPGESINFRRYWNVFRREKWLILGGAIAAALVAASVARVLTPVYSASATVLIEAELPNVVSIEEVYTLEARNQQYYDTQFEILRSQSLVESVIANLSLLDRSEFNPRGPAGFDVGAWLGGLLGETTQQNPDPMQGAIDRYYAGLSIEPVGETQLVRVRFESPDAELAAEIANAHAQAYIESMLDAKLAVTESAATWMSKRLEEMRHKLTKSESELQAFREREQLVDVNGLRALPSQEINDLSARLLEVRQGLSAAEIAYSQVSQVGSGSKTVALQSIPAILDDPAVQTFQEAYAAAQRRVAELSDRYGPRHPTMIAARAELETARANLAEQRESVAERIRTEYEAAQAEEQAIERALGRARQEYQNIGRKESELNALQRAVDTNRQLYDLFYNRVSETAATEDLQTAQARIVDAAKVPLLPAKPNKLLIVAGSFVGALLLGLIIAYVNDSLNNTLRSTTDVEEKIGLPLLAMVPLLGTKEQKKAEAGIIVDAEYNEAVRTIRTNISLDNTEQPHKIVLVTSAIGGEGKSTVALNLAASFAKAGRTLLIDADMRRPSIGHMMNLPKYDAGLSELLSKQANLRNCLTLAKVPQLHVMRTGFIPPDPLQLLSQPRLAKILRVLSSGYEHIVIDSPPILPVSDAAVLSQYADAVVVVAKADATPVPQIRAGLDLLARVEAPITGIVLNQLDLKKARKYSDFGYGGYYESYTGHGART